MNCSLVDSFHSFLVQFFNKILGNFECENQIISIFSMFIFKKTLKKILYKIPIKSQMKNILEHLRNKLVNLNLEHLEPATQSKLR